MGWVWDLVTVTYGLDGSDDCESGGMSEGAGPAVGVQVGVCDGVVEAIDMGVGCVVDVSDVCDVSSVGLGSVVAVTMMGLTESKSGAGAAIGRPDAMDNKGWDAC